MNYNYNLETYKASYNQYLHHKEHYTNICLFPSWGAQSINASLVPGDNADTSKVSSVPISTNCPHNAIYTGHQISPAVPAHFQERATFSVFPTLWL